MSTGPTWRVRLPLWLKIVVWGALIVLCYAGAHGLPSRIAAAALMALAVAGIAATSRPLPDRALAWLAAGSCAVSVITVLLAPNGVGEVAMFVAVTRFPYGFDSRVGAVFTVAATIGAGAVVAWISGSPAAALAGLGVPLLVQRSMDHRALVAERDRARTLLAELEASREAEAAAAALRERGRIARDLHDLLAHSLAGLSLQVQAARAIALREGAPAAVLTPLDTAAALARDGLGEARAAVSALRDPVTLGLDALPALVERFPGTATLTVDGEPGEFDPGAAHAVYRAVQESLTNAARYAPGASVAVALTWRPAALQVRVSDEGPPADRAVTTGVGTGLGLAGMAERLRAAGGTMRAGPRPEGGWQVSMEVPR